MNKTELLNKFARDPEERLADCAAPPRRGAGGRA